MRNTLKNKLYSSEQYWEFLRNIAFDFFQSTKKEKPKSLSEWREQYEEYSKKQLRKTNKKR